MRKTHRSWHLLLRAVVRQFDRDVRRGTYHPRTAIRVTAAPERLYQQDELFGEHWRILLLIELQRCSGYLSCRLILSCSLRQAAKMVSSLAYPVSSKPRHETSSRHRET